MTLLIVFAIARAWTRLKGMRARAALAAVMVAGAAVIITSLVLYRAMLQRSW